MNQKVKSLSEILLAADRRERVNAGFVTLIEDFVADRGGLKGMAYRAGMAMIQKARPGILQRGVDKLLPLYLQALDPLYQEFAKAGGSDFAAYLQKHSKRAAEALIAVADQRITRASDSAQKYYGKFRGGADEEVRNLLPGLSKLIQKNL